MLATEGRLADYHDGVMVILNAGVGYVPGHACTEG